MNHNYFHLCSEKVHLYSEEHGIEPTSPETDVQLPQIHPNHPKTVNKKQSMISMQDVLRPEAFGSVDSWIKKGSWQRFLERKSLDSAWPKVDQGLTFDA